MCAACFFRREVGAAAPNSQASSRSDDQCTPPASKRFRSSGSGHKLWRRRQTTTDINVSHRRTTHLADNDRANAAAASFDQANHGCEQTVARAAAALMAQFPAVLVTILFLVAALTLPMHS